MFNHDHGSVAEKGPNPGNWEAAQPVEIFAFAQDLLLFSFKLWYESVGASTRVARRGAAQVCLEVALHGWLHDGTTTFADSRYYLRVGS